jgi:MFS family permease
MIFVIASFCNFLGPLVLGFILDSYGPRACSVVSIVLITVGSAMFAMSDQNSLPLFIPGMCLIAFGGPGTQNAIIHLSNLFPEWKATATSFIVGSFQLSFIVFLIFDTLWSTMKYSYTTLFTGYAVICVFNVLVSLLLWPDQPYHLEDVAPELAEEEEAEEHSKLPRAPAVSILLIHFGYVRTVSLYPNAINASACQQSDCDSKLLLHYRA